MRKTALILSFLFITLSCSNDEDKIVLNKTVNLNFSHEWNGTEVTNTDFNSLKFTNENGEQLSIERLRYLISDITFTKSDGEVFTVNNYNLVDVTNNKNLNFVLQDLIPPGTYNDVSFTFGFTNEKNIDGAYNDLNSASWFVPKILGGGYHYMQFDGKFINNSNEQQGFNYHAIRAVNNPGTNPTFPQDTFFAVNLGPATITKDITLNITMNIAEWFKNPNTWDLNELNQMLMANSMAQIKIHANGQSVFKLESIN